MKKFISILLAASMLFTMVACNKKTEDKKTKTAKETKAKEEIEIEYVGETLSPTDAVVETTAEVVETEPPAPVKGPHAEHICPAPVVNDGCSEFDLAVPAILVDDYVFNFPSFIIEKGDEAAINAEALELVQKAASDDFYTSSDVAWYVYNDTITIILRVIGDWDIILYYIWIVDSTGHRLSNDEILAMSINEYPTVEEAGATATVFYINNKYDQDDGVPMIVDGKLNPDHGLATWFPEDPISWTFNNENINNDMIIGLDSDGCLIMCSEIIALGGANTYEELYNDDGVGIMHFFTDINS